jgi:hypothetical protein
MTAIAHELDEKLKKLDAKAALSLEKLVRDALDLVETNGRTPSITSTRTLSSDFFQRIAAEFGNEPFDLPPQGEFEKREDWE